MKRRRKMWTFILASVVFVAAGAASVTAPAQSLPIVGPLFSASKVLRAGQSVVVAHAPLKGQGHFVLCQVCADEGGVILSGKPRVGFIAIRPGPAGKETQPSGPPCINFTPGFPLPPEEELICRSASNSSSACSVTWVIEK
jgi:hypothetical protein